LFAAAGDLRMAPPEMKKRFVVRFELGLFGLCSLALVCFCIFLWMFLLGLWAGQTLLAPAAGDKAAETSPADVPSRVAENIAAPSPQPVPEQRQEQAEAVPPAGPDTEVVEPSLFVLQVSAYRDPDLAVQEVSRLRTAGYDAFAVPPEEGEDPFTRVYIGRFDSLAEATQMAIRLEEQEQIKVYTSLLPVSKIRGP